MNNQNYGTIYCIRKEAKNEVGDKGFNYIFMNERVARNNDEVFHTISFEPNSIEGFIHAMVRIEFNLEDEGWDDWIINETFTSWTCFTIESESVNLTNWIVSLLHIRPQPLFKKEDRNDSIRKSDETTIGTIYCYTLENENGNMFGFMDGSNHKWDKDCFHEIKYYPRISDQSFNEAMNKIISKIRQSDDWNSVLCDQDDLNWSYINYGKSFKSIQSLIERIYNIEL